MDSTIDIQILSTPLDTKHCYKFVTHPSCGGINFFVGTVRDSTHNKKVKALDFEAYEPMAISEMQKIATQMMDMWPIVKVSMHHRIGKLEIGEIAVVIAVSSAHRKATFEACQYAIDTLKKTVPIWKKEIFEDGEVWVAAHP